MKKYRWLLLLTILYANQGLAQFNSSGTQFYIGPKVSTNIARYTAGKNIAEVPQANQSKMGFGGGLMYKFKVTDLISLHGEFNYTRKTRSVADSAVATEFQNFHIDAPILFEAHFPAKNKYIGKFEYYFNIGPQLSYWLKGTGKTTLRNNNSVSSTYKLNLEDNNTKVSHGGQFNRLQYGLVLGAGLTLPSVGDNFFVVEGRYFYCQTFLGADYQTNRNNIEYEDNLRGNYQIFSISLSYIFGLNFMPESEKKGAKMKTVVK